MKIASIEKVSRARKPRSTVLRQVPTDAAPEPAPNLGAVAEPDQPFEEGVHDAIDPDLRHRLISEAAYDLYTQRGYVDGFDVEDWLSAEAQVDHLLLNPQFARANTGEQPD